MVRGVSLDVLVVLGCRLVQGRLSPAAERRVERAARAFREHGAALVIASGGKAWDGAKECDVFARGLVERGVDAAIVWQETESLSTRGNARGVAKLLRGRGAHDVTIVTCDWHLPRALRLFARAGIDASGLAAESPPRSTAARTYRALREKASLLLDLTLGRLLGLALLLTCLTSLFGCTSRSPAGAAQRVASATPHGAAAPAASALLQAELRRDASAVSDDDVNAEDEARRLAAVRTLARIQDPKSFATLQRALSDRDLRVVEWAAFGVGQLCRDHRPEAVRHLTLRATSLAATATPRDSDRAFAALSSALGRCESDEAEKVLRSWLERPGALSEAATLGLGLLARRRERLDEVTLSVLLDHAAKNPEGIWLYPLEGLPSLGRATRARLLEVAQLALDRARPGRPFAIRALGRAGPEAATALGHALESPGLDDAERADAARALAALGAAGQTTLLAALETHAGALIHDAAWSTSRTGVVLTLLEGLEPGARDSEVLSELSRLPLDGDAPSVVRRKVMLRCRAAAALAGRASDAKPLLDCDPAPLGERREGTLAELKVLGRKRLDSKRSAARFSELARSPDRVVREAALELLSAHDEVPAVPQLLADALTSSQAGVIATAAKLLSRYPARAQTETPEHEATVDRPTTPASTDPGVVHALGQALSTAAAGNNIELWSALLDAAVSLELLSAKPALERACASTNPTLREHAEHGYAAFGEPQRRCPLVAGSEPWSATVPNYRVELDTDVGPLSLTLRGDESPFATERFVLLSRTGFFDGMLVQRAVPGFVVQFGDPDGDGFGGPKDLPPLRCQRSDRDFAVGSVGVALSGRDTGLSQFFVTLRRAPHLDGEYSWVGSASAGFERLAPGDRIVHVRALEVRDK